MRFSQEERRRIKELKGDGKSSRAIADVINRDRRTQHCTFQGVSNLLKRMSVPFKPRPVRCRRLRPAALAFIDRTLNTNPETSAPELQRLLLNRFNVSASLTLIRSERRKMGWKYDNTKYCQMLRAVNQKKRFFFCSKFLARGECFNDFIFTDESTVKCERFLSKCFRKVGQPRVMRPKPKHPLAVHVWAGMSR